METREFEGLCPNCAFIFFKERETENEQIESITPKHQEIIRKLDKKPTVTNKICQGSGKKVILRDTASPKEKKRRILEKERQAKQQAEEKKIKKQKAIESLRLTIVCPIKGALLWRENEFTLISNGWKPDGLRRRSLEEWLKLFKEVGLNFRKTLTEIVKQEIGADFTVAEREGRHGGMFGDRFNNLLVVTKESGRMSCDKDDWEQDPNDWEQDENEDCEDDWDEDDEEIDP